jgi:hypothetical protein
MRRASGPEEEYMRFTYVIRAAFIAILLIATCAQAAVLGTYSDRATWEGLVSGQSNIDFSGYAIAVGGWSGYSTAAGLTESGVNFVGHSGAGYDLYLTNPPAGASDNFQSGVRLRGPVWETFQATYTQITLSPLTAFALELGTGFPNALGVKIELSSGEIFFVGTAGAPARTFWGVRTDTDISWIRVSPATSADGYTQPTGGSSYIVMDNFSFGSSGAGGGGPLETPDAPTVTYMMSGLAMIGMGRRWKFRKG